MNKKICIVYTHHKLGDLIWQLPYIKAISEHHNIKVDLILREKTQAKNILKDLNHIDNINYNDFRKGIYYWIDVWKLIKIYNNNKNVKNLNKNSLDNFELVKNSAMRKTIADRLVKSKNESPHFYLSLDCNIDELIKIRTALNSKAKDQYKISVNDMIIKASSAALMKVPRANASWENENTKYFYTTDISVAVAIEGGLITPIIKDVQSKGLLEISKDMKNLADKD